MGNRAVITTNQILKDIGIYLHWNGGRDSIEGFCAYCKLKGYRSPESDNYGWTYLAGVISNFFGGSYSCGLDIACNLDCDNYDNGVFIIKNWMIVGRKFKRSSEQYEYDLKEFLESVDSRMPDHMKLTTEEWAEFENVKNQVMEARKNTLQCCE